MFICLILFPIGNGEISFQEFMTTLSVASRGSAEEKLHWTFRMYDINGNGTISRSEATEMIKVTVADLACRTLQAVDVTKQITTQVR